MNGCMLYRRMHHPCRAATFVFRPMIRFPWRGFCQTPFGAGHTGYYYIGDGGRFAKLEIFPICSSSTPISFRIQGARLSRTYTTAPFARRLNTWILTKVWDSQGFTLAPRRSCLRG